ncbi:DUF6300 family protein [Streptomyces sp. PAN_FS17]|uniref:DUF6300 family protein n=1 Tax=Streptomyces sp. PAN_FS17 TaxID=1855351 RepID=UPI00352858E1
MFTLPGQPHHRAGWRRRTTNTGGRSTWSCAPCATPATWSAQAAGLLVQWFADTGGHDEIRVKEGSHLLTEWTKECMAAHGWYLQDTPPDQH